MNSTPSEPAGGLTAVPRILDLAGTLARKSCFLFGPRQTGKTSLLRRALPEARHYDLLDAGTWLRLSRDPGRLGQELTPGDRIVTIDEIQRLPILLNEVHRLIEERGTRFLLTGSSARKLRRGEVNLLGGRARTKYLHPLCRRELGGHFDLERALARGLVPSVYFSDDPGADLTAYVGNYIEQEVAAEGAVRNLPAFSRFLAVAAACNGTIVNFTKLASDAQVARTTLYEYFAVLRDTLLLHELPAFRASVRRKPVASSKYYFFDVGVVGALQGRPFRPGTPEFGSALETWLFQELRCWRDYVSGDPLSFWRSTSGFEVDFLVGDHTAIELKATRNVAPSDLRSLRALAEEKRFRNLVCVALEDVPRRAGDIAILPPDRFLDALWAGEFG